MAQAREPAFYATAGVPDTIDGRFGMIGVHMFLLLERLRREGEAGQMLGQALLEAFMTDIDDNLREIGISDLGVPRRVKKAAAGLLEHLEAYREAFPAADAAPLEALLHRHLLLAPDASRAADIARYMHAAAADLDSQTWSDLAAGNLTFPVFAA